MFSIVRDTHSRIGHGGERKTFLEVKKKWANVTLEICKICIRCCKDCQLKRKKKIPKGLVVKSIVSSSIMSMGQVNPINYQTMPDGKFNYLITYVDHFSKFCFLRPLTSKSSEEVAQNLFDVFLLIGAPAILQSDSGQDLHCGDDDSCAEETTSNGVESDLSKAASNSSRQRMEFFKSDQNKNDNDPNDQRSTTTELGD
ncbi:KRAB-A domain-containing protein 2 [Trichinella spiralis]|uniref:KRAB-A domain-containing protein 2 n=1 Tax=Trichinella spiralis TaxID=6334 RepID=UPI0001EFC759|nr:KRAB-A domain-containing protein 2 [Trichinella spiralis]